jgi:hypothetical protein
MVVANKRSLWLNRALYVNVLFIDVVASRGKLGARLYGRTKRSAFEYPSTGDNVHLGFHRRISSDFMSSSSEFRLAFLMGCTQANLIVMIPIQSKRLAMQNSMCAQFWLNLCWDTYGGNECRDE